MSRTQSIQDSSSRVELEAEPILGHCDELLLEFPFLAFMLGGVGTW